MRQIESSESRSSLRLYLGVSVLVHVLLSILIAVGILAERHDVQLQEAFFIAEIEREEKRLAEEQKTLRERTVADLLGQQALAEMAQLVSDQLEPPDEDKLLELTEADIREQVAEWDAAMELDALLNEAFYELSDALRSDAFGNLREHLKQMKQDLLLSQVRAFIRNRVAPEIKQRIDGRLKQELGELIKDRTVRQASDQAKGTTTPERVAPRHDVTGQQREQETDALERRMVDAAAERVESAVRERVEKEVVETAVPRAAGRIMRALDTDIKRRKLDDEKFRDFLEKDIRRALKEDMQRQAPVPELALEKTLRHFELKDDAAIERAREQVAEVADKLAALAAQQESLRDAIPEDAPSKDGMKQHFLAGDIRTTRAEARWALDTARRATLMHDRQVSESEQRLRKPEVERTAVEAARAIEREVVVDAKQMMSEVAEDLHATAESMARLAEDLAGEAATIEQLATDGVDLAEALGEEAAETAVERIVEQAEKAADQRVKPDVAWAANTVDVSGILGDEAKAEAMAKMAELEERLDQVARNMAEGRGLEDLLGMGMAAPGRGIGPGGLPSQENLPWTLPHMQAMNRINLKAYQEFVKDMRDRLNPDNYYGDEDPTAEDPATVARASDAVQPVVMFVEETGTADVTGSEDEPRREVPRPDFKTLEFGAAPMMETPVKVDGDLSDWGELRHGLNLRYVGDSLTKVEDGPTVHVRWSPDGLYFAYTVEDPNGIQPCPKYSWAGDCLEVMLDMANSRRPDAYLNVDAQKFQLTPFGAKGRSELRVWEMGRGLRGLRMAVGYPDVEGIKGYSAARRRDGGYALEGFISRRALARPLLVPGKYIGLNFSLNRGNDSPYYQWSASQKLATWRRPDTWGDLLLLGSDARLKFTDSSDPGVELSAVVPDDIIGVEVHDADMNINTRKIDRVPAELQTASGTSLFVVLAETEASSGIFRASVNTQPYFVEPKEDTLNVRSGTTVELVYTDARCEYGERNRRVTAELPVAWPVMTLGGN